MRFHLFIFSLFVFLTAVMTYPLIHSLPIAMKGYGDPFFNAWTLAFTQHQLLTDPLHLFDANIFYPHELTLAYSEHQLASALLALPIFLLGGGPILVHNVVFFLTFVLCGTGATLLVRHLTGNSWAAVLAGIAFAFSSYRFTQLTHLQILSFHWIPFCLLFLHKAFQSPSWKNFLLFALFFLGVMLSSNYLGIIFLIFLGGLILIGHPKLWWANKGAGVKKCLLVLIGAGLLFLPLALPYVKVKEKYGFERQLTDVKQYSAKAENYLGVSPNSKIYPQFLKKLGKPERHLFFGFVVMGIALIGLFFAKRFSLRLRLAYFAVLLLSFLLSMGIKAKFLGLDLHGWPYRFFYDYMIGFDGMRVPARFAINVGLCLVVLAGYGFAFLFEKIQKKSLSLLLVSLFSVAILAEGWAAPLRFIHFDVKPPAVHLWLKDQKDVNAILFLPAYINRSVYLEMNSVYWSYCHWKKMMNGYSGFFPPGWDEFKMKLQQFPTKETIDQLRQQGVNYCVINKHKYSGALLTELEKRLSDFSEELVFVQQCDGQTVYRIQEKGIQN